MNINIKMRNTAKNIFGLIKLKRNTQKVLDEVDEAIGTSRLSTDPVYRAEMYRLYVEKIQPILKKLDEK